MSIGDVSPQTLAVVSTIAAAIAAIAACATVGIDIWRDRKSHVPNISATPGRPTDGSGPTIAFANAGPGLAIALTYFGVDGGFQFGGGVGPGGHLMPFAEATDRVALPQWTATHPTLIHSCRDTRGGLHIWSADGGYNHSEPKRGEWPSEGDKFRMMYPEVSIPEKAFDPNPPLIRWG